MADIPEDPQLVARLDDYLERLQRGEHPDREALLASYPQLRSALDCFDALEGMAPQATGGAAGDATREFSDVPDHLPRDFGSYELLAEIGRGGMGVVYRARQKGLERMVAVKMILAGFLASPEHVRRFQVEARAAAGLRHPHIVQIHEVGQVHGQHFFAMEYIAGLSLAQRIAQGPIDPQTAAWLIAQVSRAVAHLHEHGIVHRDLKPSNILLDEDQTPYVTDFGLAKVFQPGSEMTTTGVIAGTPSYMAPEQAAGRGAEVGPASDIYSLGAILYELLTGRPVYREESPLDTLLAVMTGEPIPPRELNPKIPRPIQIICMKCLARAPGDRYASAGALADDLERFLKGEAIRARPPSLVERLWIWTRREPALATRLAALGVFYLVETINYRMGIVRDAVFHRDVSLLIAVWAVSSILLQQSLKIQRWSLPARFVWGTLDAAVLLAMLLVGNGLTSSLMVGYPLLIAASGLWFRVRFVWFMTALAMASYGVLLVDFYVWRHAELQRYMAVTCDRHVVFLVAMVVLAGAVSYLVQRVRALSSYYGERL
jgi:serine/threonine-protein kinase